MFLSEETRTLRLSGLPGRTLFLSLIILALIVGVVEVAARQDSVQSRLPPPAVGSQWIKFNFHADLIEKANNEQCILLGSSIVRMALDPAVIAAAYEAQTGDALECFNFGENGLFGPDAPLIAEYLLRSYHPRLLVYGFALRDFEQQFVELGRTAKDPARLPWVRYRRGDWNVNGWLIDGSTALRLYLGLGDWLTSGNDLSRRFDHYQRDYAVLEAARGYEADSRVLEMTPQLAASTLEEYQLYRIAPASLEGLRKLAALQAAYPDTEIVLVELPVLTRIYTEYMAPALYAELVTEIEAIAETHAIPLWRLSYRAFPDESAWGDTVHMNQDGARIASAWLGEQVGAAALRGDLVLADRTH